MHLTALVFPLWKKFQTFLFARLFFHMDIGINKGLLSLLTDSLNLVVLKTQWTKRIKSEETMNPHNKMWPWLPFLFCINMKWLTWSNYRWEKSIKCRVLCSASWAFFANLGQAGRNVLSFFCCTQWSKAKAKIRPNCQSKFRETVDSWDVHVTSTHEIARIHDGTIPSRSGSPCIL